MLSRPRETLPEGLALWPTEALLARFELPAPAPEVAPAAAFGTPGGTAELAAGTTEARQGIRVGSLNLMLRYIDGSELTELPPVHRLPHAPAWFRGMSNLHGTLIPVLDLATWLGAEGERGARPMLLVLGHGADAAGVLIDGLPVRLRYDAGRTAVQEDCAPRGLLRFVSATHLIDDAVWFDLDVAALLAAIEAALGPPQ